MNEDTIKMIEEQLRLRNERQALREKEYSLSAKKWRARGTTLAIVALFVICGMAVCYGGWGVHSFSETIANKEKIQDTWPLVIAVIMNGLFVLAGLGVAAFTVKNIANYNNELE